MSNQFSEGRLLPSSIPEGTRFGKLVVVERLIPLKPALWRYKCLCDCGRFKTTLGRCLLYNKSKVKNCGCLQKEICHKISRRKESGYSIGKNLVFEVRKASAKKRGIVFNLTLDEFFNLSKQPCHYCGAAPFAKVLNKGSYGSFTYNGLDRKVPSDGYVITNLLPCCWICNVAKGTMSYEEFIQWVKRVAENFKNVQVTDFNPLTVLHPSSAKYKAREKDLNRKKQI